MVVVNNSIEFLPSHKKSTYKLDPTKKPKEYEIIQHRVDFGDETGKGIYLLEGDRLTLCAGKRDNQRRPTRFESSKDPPTDLVVLQRIRESAAPGKTLHPPRKPSKQ